MDYLTRNVLRNSATGIGAQFAIKLLSFGFTITVVRELGAAAYGEYAAVLAFGTLFVFAADLGLSPFSVREVARLRDEPNGDEDIRRLYADLLRLRFLLSIVTALALISTAWLTGRPPMMVAAIALGTLGLVMYSLQGASEAVLGGFERLDVAAKAKVGSQAVFIAAGAAALWMGAGYLGLVVANLLAVAILTYLCWLAVRRLGVRPGEGMARRWPSMLRASLPLGVVAFTLGISYRFDSVLLNVTRGDVETGWYNAVYNLIFSAVIISNAINAALYPSLTRLRSSAPGLMPASCSRALRWLAVFALPITIGTWVVADQLVPFLFTASYAPAAPVLQILIWATPLMFASEFFGYVLLIQGLEGRVARAVIGSTAANAGLNLLLVPQFGLYAAALVTVVTEAVLVVQYGWVLRRMLMEMDWDKILLRPLLAALVMGAATAGGLMVLPLPLTILLAVLVYAVFITLFGGVAPDELGFLRTLSGAGRRALATATEPDTRADPGPHYR